MVRNQEDLNHWRQRFFGWFPYERPSKWFLLANLVYIGFCMFIWPAIPTAYVFGWWPLHDILGKALIGTWASVMWGLYYYKWWPKLKDGIEDEEPAVKDNMGVKKSE